MLCKSRMRFLAIFVVTCLLSIGFAKGDEQLFGFVRGAETLPAHRWEVYQFATLSEGKSEGSYLGTHFETEAEYGITDQLQASLSVVQHFFNNNGVDGDRDALR